MKKVHLQRNYIIDKFRAILLAYILAGILLNLYFLPPSLEIDWFNFFNSLKEDGVFPYIGSREGYPPIGFLPYFLLYFLSRESITNYIILMRSFNFFFLVLTGVILSRICRNNLKIGILYLLLPSSLIFLAIGNDMLSIALALLSIYMYMRGNTFLSGIMIGLSIMTKLLTAPLIIPLLVHKRYGVRKRVEVLFGCLVTVVIVSFPFFILEPYSYVSSYLSNLTRGPWETIWALLDGWYSHGGFLIPQWVKYIYHGQATYIFGLSSWDHAFYDWNMDLLRSAMFFLPIVGLVISLLYSAADSTLHNKVSFSMYLFSLIQKGYSPQFNVILTPFLLMSNISYKVPLLISIELSSLILGLIVWKPVAIPYKTELLTVCIVARTLAFTLTALLMMIRGTVWSPLKFLIERESLRVQFSRTFRKGLIPAISISMIVVAFTLASTSVEQKKVVTISGSAIKDSDTYSLSLKGFAEGDRVIIALNANSNVTVYGDSRTHVVDPMHLFFNPTFTKNNYIFFIANKEYHDLMIVFPHQTINGFIYHPSTSKIAILNNNYQNNDQSIQMQVFDIKSSVINMVRIAFPLNKLYSCREMEEIRGSISLLDGSVERIIIDLHSITGELYGVEVAPNGPFILTCENRDIFGRSLSELRQISAVSIVLFGTANGTIVNISKNIDVGNKTRISLLKEQQSEVEYTVYIAKRASSLSLPSILFILSGNVLLLYTISFLLKTKKYQE